MSETEDNARAVLLCLGGFWQALPYGTTMELTKDQVEILGLKFDSRSTDLNELAKFHNNKGGKQYTGPTLESAMQEIKNYLSERAELYYNVPWENNCPAWTSVGRSQESHPPARTLTYNPRILLKKGEKVAVRVLCNGYHQPPWVPFESRRRDSVARPIAQGVSTPSAEVTLIMQQCSPGRVDPPASFGSNDVITDASCGDRVAEVLALTQYPLHSLDVESSLAIVSESIGHQGSSTSPLVETGVSFDSPPSLSTPKSSLSVESHYKAPPRATKKNKENSRTHEKQKAVSPKVKVSRPVTIVMAKWWPSLPLGFEFQLSSDEVEVVKTKPDRGAISAWENASKDLTWTLIKKWTARDAERAAYQVRNHLLNKRHEAPPSEYLCEAWEAMDHRSTEEQQHPWTRILKQIPKTDSEKGSDLRFRAVCDGRHEDPVSKRQKRQKIVDGRESRSLDSGNTSLQQPRSRKANIVGDGDQKNKEEHPQNSFRKVIRVSPKRGRFDPQLVPWLANRSRSAKPPTKPRVSPCPNPGCK